MDLTEKLKKTVEMTEEQLKNQNAVKIGITEEDTKKAEKTANELLDKTENPTKQLLNEIEVKEPKIVEKKKQAVSISYTLTSFKENAKKFKEAGLINHQEWELLERMRQEICIKWIDSK